MTCKQIFLMEYFYIKKYILPLMVLISLTFIVFYLSIPKALTNQIKGVEPVSIGVELPSAFIVDNRELLSLFATSPMIKHVQIIEGQSKETYDIQVSLPDNLEGIIFEGEGGKVGVNIEDSRVGYFMLPMIRQGMDMLLIYQGNSLKLSQLVLNSDLSEEEKDQLMLNFNESLIAQLIFRNNYLTKEKAPPRYLITLISLLIFIWLVAVSFFSQVILMDQLSSNLLKKMRLKGANLMKVIGVKLALISVINTMGLGLLYFGLSKIGEDLAFLSLFCLILLLGVTLTLFLFFLMLLGFRFSLTKEVLTISGGLFFIWLLLSGLVYPLTSQLNQLQIFNPASVINNVVFTSFNGSLTSMLSIFTMIVISLICLKGSDILWGE